MFLFGLVCSVLLVLLLNVPKLPPPFVALDVTMAEKIQLERRKLIEEKCQATEGKTRKNSGPVHFKIEAQHRAIFCDVPKVLYVYGISNQCKANQRKRVNAFIKWYYQTKVFVFLSFYAGGQYQLKTAHVDTLRSGKDGQFVIHFKADGPRRKSNVSVERF
jgi:hypothetical protein